MPYTITSTSNRLGDGLYATAEDAAAALSTRLLRGEALAAETRITEIALDDGLDPTRKAGRAHAEILSAAARGLEACRQLAAEGRLATARATSEAFRAVLAAAGLAEVSSVRGAAVVVVEEIRAAKAPAPEPEPEPDPREIEPAEPIEGVRG